MWQLWLIVAGIFFIGEIITVGFLIFWLGIGALLAMIVSFFTDNILIQTAVFVMSSTVLILFSRFFVNKYISKKTIRTNAASLIGKHAKVTKEISPVDSIGLVKIGGDTWSAVSEDGTQIKQNTEVEIKGIQGVKLIVSPVKEKTNI